MISDRLRNAFVDPHTWLSFLFTSAEILMEHAAGHPCGPLKVRISRSQKADVIYEVNEAAIEDLFKEAETVLFGVQEREWLVLLERAFLSYEETCIVEVLKGKALPSSAIARYCHRKNTGSFRQLLSNLVSRGIIKTGQEGYSLTNPMFRRGLSRIAECSQEKEQQSVGVIGTSSESPNTSV